LDGAVVQGPAVSYEPVEITQADKDAWMEARANPQGGAVFVAVDAGGGARAAAPAGGARFEGPQFDDDDWPDVKPPFPAGAVAVTPEGNVWVRRHVKAGSLLEYDVFDGKGRPVQTVVLPEQGRVVGFGKGVVFVARSDEYDLQWLERYQRFWLERR